VNGSEDGQWPVFSPASRPLPTAGAAVRDVLRARLLHGSVTAADILPPRHLRALTDPVDLAPHVFEDCLPGFAETIGAGDMLVSTAAFGTGRASERTVAALRAVGVRLVTAPDFGRTFFRHCWSLGVPAVRADVSAFTEGQIVGVDLDAGAFTGAPALPTFPRPGRVLIELAEVGGRLPLEPARTPRLATITPIGRATTSGRRRAGGAGHVATIGACRRSGRDG
jgi:3-isopropylmalate/(R)-2-methylmalate dehydratase small subunit